MSEEVTLGETVLGGVTDGFETAASDSDEQSCYQSKDLHLGILMKLMMDS